ncbi:hypothetical protein MALGJ_42170 [Mycolicibacter algericus]|uniref:Uncharacterized protein n=1 Tax=Mycolicibacter algericus TaxID=1288388 RepID=A0A7I9YFS6_MYCAL|nr:hypothetical protein MALGJ_42170 [Mycolicibacter algericus]
MVFGDRDGLHVAATQRSAAVQQVAPDHCTVGDKYAAAPDEGVHTAERVLPVAAGGRVTCGPKGVVDELAGAATGVVVQIGGVDQACGVDLAGHPPAYQLEWSDGW